MRFDHLYIWICVALISMMYGCSTSSTSADGGTDFPNTRISGSVRLSTGKVASGTVGLYPIGFKPASDTLPPENSATIDSNGEFSVNVKNGNYNLLVLSATGEASLIRNIACNGDKISMDIPTSASASLQIIPNPATLPLSAAYITGTPFIASASSDTLVFTDLPQGVLPSLIGESANGSAELATELSVQASQTNELFLSSQTKVQSPFASATCIGYLFQSNAILLGTASNGFAIYSPGAMTWQTVAATKSPWLLSGINSFSTDSISPLLVSTDSGVLCYTTDSLVPYHGTMVDSPTIKADRGSDSSCWLLQNSTVSFISSASGKVTIFPHSGFDIAIVGNTGYLATRDSGVFAINQTLGTVQITSPAIPSDSISAIAAIGDSACLVATKSGLAECKASGTIILDTMFSVGKLGCLKGIYPSANGIWLLTSHGTLYFRTETSTDQRSGTFDGIIDGTVDAAGRLWLLDPSGSLYGIN